MYNFNIETFITASNKKLYNNDLFNYKNRNKNTIVVEGPEDISFYKSFLLNVYDDIFIPNIICVNNGKKEVLKLAKNNNSKQYQYIVDLDYDYKEKLNKSGAITTTGYSMENFYFYIDDNNNNLNKLINSVCIDYGLINRAEDYIEYELLKELNKYLDDKLYYYAYMKTLHEYNRPFSKKVKDNPNNYLDVIKKEFEGYSSYEKTKLRAKFIENINLIKETKYLFVRGHDLFDIMYEYFMNCKYIDNSKITMKYIFSLARNLYVPEDFANSLKR